MKIILNASQLKKAIDLIPDNEEGELEEGLTIYSIDSLSIGDKIGIYAYLTLHPEDGSTYLGK